MSARRDCCRFLARVAAAGAMLLLSACATVPPGAGKTATDPWERVNRQTYAFNDRLDRYLIKPIAQGYKFVLPDVVRQCVSNGFANMAEIRNAINDILQIKLSGVANDTGRLVINSTLGLAGCFDFATGMGLERRHEDFGLTLARWGVGTGPYVVLPVLGPSDVRDGIGLVPDAYASPTAYVQLMPVVARNSLLGTNVVDTRASLLDTTKLLQDVALDPYQFTRDAYLQRRRSQEYEGNPPPPKLEEDDGGDAAPTPPAPAPAPGATGGDKATQPPGQEGR